VRGRGARTFSVLAPGARSAICSHLSMSWSFPAIAQFRGSSDSPLRRVKALDDTRAFFAEGYEYISNRCRALDTDVFETRLLLKRATCMRGEEAARLFYGPGNFSRSRSVPPTTLRLLQDEKSVNSLEGAPHRRRKAMFLSITEGDGLHRLADELEIQWRIAMVSWAHDGAVVFHDRVREVLCRTVCLWAGVPIGDDVLTRTAQLSEMVERAGSFGLPLVRALVMRSQAERWARGLIASVRSNQLSPASETALAIISQQKDEAGQLLPLEVAGVELLNVLRPVVAVARFIVFAALALHENPALREQLRVAPERMRFSFVQEVRRFYPFFPAVGGRAMRDVSFREHHIPKDAWVLFDLYGTNHDARLWPDPYSFRADRFEERAPAVFDLVPQGGGEVRTSHRCPGEDLTVVLMLRSLRLLVGAMEYDVPPQNLTVDLSRIPALPATGLVMAGIRSIG
jgi:fatty-acid peroxygenase